MDYAAFAFSATAKRIGLADMLIHHRRRCFSPGTTSDAPDQGFGRLQSAFIDMQLGSRLPNPWPLEVVCASHFWPLACVDLRIATTVVVRDT
jgi:hypothetical protein